MSSEEVVDSWISNFCTGTGHEYFAQVSEEFIEDDFNLTGLPSQVPMYKEALEMILDVEPEEDEEEEEEEEEEEDDDEELGDQRALGYRRAGDRKQARENIDLSGIEVSADLLYGLIHQRFIISRPGLGQMHDKYERAEFGYCPRVFCDGCKVLPVGCSDTPGQETVKLFCLSCLDVYTPPNSRFQTVDGAFFGTTFGCLFFMTFPEVDLYKRPAGSPSPGAPAVRDPSAPTFVLANQPPEINGIATSSLAPGLGPGSIYEPRIYGFRVSERAKSGPRMKWLRMKPADVRELDESRKYHADDVDEEPPEDELSPESPQQRMDRRKKAPIRRKRRISSEEGTAPVNTNGINGVG